MKTKECICGKQNFSSFHVLNECEKIEELEKSINENSKSKLTREIRLKEQFNPKSDLLDQCWMINWCLWKTFWCIVFKQTSNPKKNLLGELKECEYAYIKLNQNKFTKQKVNYNNKKLNFSYFTPLTIQQV